MWEESKETDQGPDDLEHLVLKHLKSMNNPTMITMINNTCLSLVSFSMKYLRNKLLSSTRKLQITFLLEICDSSIQFRMRRWYIWDYERHHIVILKTIIMTILMILAARDKQLGRLRSSSSSSSWKSSSPSWWEKPDKQLGRLRSRLRWSNGPPVTGLAEEDQERNDGWW